MRFFGLVPLFATALLASAKADLVAHYALDEAGGGSVVTDSLGNNPGALIGSGTATKGVSAPHGRAMILS